MRMSSFLKPRINTKKEEQNDLNNRLANVNNRLSLESIYKRSLEFKELIEKNVKPPKIIDQEILKCLDYSVFNFKFKEPFKFYLDTGVHLNSNLSNSASTQTYFQNIISKKKYKRHAQKDIINIALVSKSWFYFIQKRVCSHLDININIENRGITFKIPILLQSLQDCFNGYSLIQPQYLTSLELKIVDLREDEEGEETFNVVNNDSNDKNNRFLLLISFIRKLPLLERITLKSVVSSHAIELLDSLVSSVEQPIVIDLVVKNLNSLVSNISRCEHLASLSPKVNVKSITAFISPYLDYLAFVDIITTIKPESVNIRMHPSGSNYQTELMKPIFEMKQMKSLYIYDGLINCNYLVDCLNHLRSLTVELNPLEGDHNKLVQLLKENKSIETLDLKYCQSNELSDLLLHNTSIRSLSIKGLNDFDLMINQSIKHLSISTNLVTDTLLNTLKLSKSIRSLEIKKEFHQQAQLEDLINIIKLDTIETLELSLSPNESMKFVLSFSNYLETINKPISMKTLFINFVSLQKLNMFQLSLKSFLKENEKNLIKKWIEDNSLILRKSNCKFK